MISHRRTFMMQAAAVAGGLACRSVMAQAVRKHIEENEPKATSLGYRHDSGQVDAARFPKHVASEKCSNCMAFLGKPADAWGDCDLMADRAVSSKGWCSSYVRGA